MRCMGLGSSYKHVQHSAGDVRRWKPTLGKRKNCKENNRQNCRVTALNPHNSNVIIWPVDFELHKYVLLDIGGPCASAGQTLWQASWGRSKAELQLKSTGTEGRQLLLAASCHQEAWAWILEKTQRVRRNLCWSLEEYFAMYVLEGYHWVDNWLNIVNNRLYLYNQTVISF